jgi:iron complex transport system permease protein
VKPWSAGRLVLTLLASTLVWAVLAAGCLMVGSTGRLGWPEGAVDGGLTIGWFYIAPYPRVWIEVSGILGIRLQRVLLASLVGAALAAAGVVYQAILRNPLAEPYLLGVSSGAMLFAYVWQLPFMTGVLAMTAFGGRAMGEQAFAFVGALLTVGIVFLLSTRRGRLEPITLLLVGVIINAINGSIFLLINSIVKETATPGGPLAFIVGGLQTNLTAQQMRLSALVVATGFLVLLYFAGQLNVAMLSEGEAQSLGVRIHRLRWIGLVVASLVTASAVAISGPIGFVGLVCPHLGRLIVGNDQRRLLPLATALGAGLLALADALSRWLSAQGRAETLLPVGVLTGLLGGPFFLLLLWQSRRRGDAP